MQTSRALQLRESASSGNCFVSYESAGLAKQDRAELATGILPVYYPKGGMFFLEGQPATGVFLLRTGRAKESMVSNKGKTSIIRVVGPGAILGLQAVLTDAPHETTIETLEPTHADFVQKASFLRLLKTSSQLGQMVSEQLSRNCREAYASMRYLSASCSVSERLARLLLHWADQPIASQKRNAKAVRIRVALTHEEISQFIGSTRETTSRILTEFRAKKWIVTRGSTWIIMNEDAIRNLAA